MAELIIFDWKRTLYDPDCRELIPNARNVLQGLGVLGLKLFLVGKDDVGDMLSETERLGVAEMFKGIHFVKESKADDDIAQFIDSSHPEQAVVVGDRVRSEIEVGNRLGLTTVWVRQGRFAEEIPLYPEQIPDYTIHSIIELMPLVERL